LGVETRHPRGDGDLRPVAGFARHGDDLDGAFGDLRNLQREKFAHQVWVGPRQGDQGLAGAAGDADDVAPQPVAVFVPLTGYLLGGGHDAVGSLGRAAHSDDDETTGVRARGALNDARDDIALPRRELAVVLLVLRIAQPLQDHLTCGGGRDATESFWGVVPFVDDVAVGVGLTRDDLDDTGLAVDVDVSVGLVAFGMAIGGQQRRLDRIDDHVDRDALVDLDGVQCRHVDVHAEASFPDWPASSSSRWFGGENSTWTTALVMPSTGSSRT